MASVTNSSELLENIQQICEKQFSKRQAELVKQFSELIYLSVSEDEFAERNPQQIFSAISSLWTFIQDFDGSSKVRVFNPNQEEDGWESRYSIIQINHKDIPFLVDSIRMELNRHGIDVHLHVHVPMYVKRTKTGRVSSLDVSYDKDSEHNENIETPMYLEVERIIDPKVMQAVEEDLVRILRDVRSTVSDWKPMRDKMISIISDLESEPPPLRQDRIEEAVDFLKWVKENHFVFMGSRTYDLLGEGDDLHLKSVKGSGLGILADERKYSEYHLSRSPKGAKKLALSREHILVLTKTSTLSTVHRSSHIDYIGVKRFNDKGEVIGEHRFFGLFTSAAYNMDPQLIPVLRKKINNVLAESKLKPGGHDYKALKNILETYPRDELFQIPTLKLLDIVMGILHIQERRQVRAFVRRDPFGRYFSVLTFVPRDTYNTRIRLKMTDILSETFSSKGEIEFTTYFSESNLVRTHFRVPVENTESISYDLDELQEKLERSAMSWEEVLTDEINKRYEGDKAALLLKKYREAFPPSFQNQQSVESAMVDIDNIEELSDDWPLGMFLYRLQDDESLRFKLYHKDTPLALSAVMPMLENMGLTVIDETPYEVSSERLGDYRILDFDVRYEEADIDVEQIRDNFHKAFAKAWYKQAENDGFNRLILAGGLDWRQVAVLRAYAKYMWQINFTFSQVYIEQTLAQYPEIANSIVELFELKFNPNDEFSQRRYALKKSQLLKEVQEVESLDQDKIINKYIELIEATLRTNFFQPDEDGKDKPYISFKLNPSIITDMPKPVLMYEIFVYSPRVEGVHLRGGKVARGGLRWSDRREDFRTEILGLVKAQQVKNSVIVPVGAKGGFVCKQLPTSDNREAYFAEGVECYKTFIRALLDITDNYVNDKLVHPRDVVVHDEPDAYLVVAADKGTATFSDIANGISEEYGHWLGDAFASGGSNGYDHKAMGITAKGAWESVKQHFREMGVDCQNEDFTVVACGDMSGDVFGNGMLLSKHIRLQVAFNHMHIFVDPNPDAATSYKERERLFNLSRSGWNDYKTDLISKGGGVFERSAKKIDLTPEIQEMLGVKAKSLSPTEFIHAALKMKADLFWNGGIGTYVKSSKESHQQVGDRANDSLRVDGKDMQVKVIGEGGNLGCTQLGRIEYMQHGGRANADFIDNAGGVNCSDNEVNIKILLNGVVSDGALTVKKRNNLLARMTDEVSDIVIEDNYRQTQSISITESRAPAMVKEHMRFIHGLEKSVNLDRKLEFLPTDEELLEREANGRGLTRAELAVLLAYGKIELKDSLCIPEVTENSYFESYLFEYFPKPLRKNYAENMLKHPLKDEIIAMSLANEMVNLMGTNFVFRVIDEVGANIGEVAQCYVMAKETFDLKGLFESIEALDNKIPASEQSKMMFQARRIVRRATRWFVRNRSKDQTIEEVVNFFRKGVAELQKNVHKTLEAKEADGIEKEIKALVERGVPEKLAKQVGYLSTMFSAMDIIELSTQYDLPILNVAEVYYKLGAEIDLHWFLNQIIAQPVSNHWQAFARAAFREELDYQQRNLIEAVLPLTSQYKAADTRIKHFLSDHDDLLSRWREMVSDFKQSSTHEFAKFSVALRELQILVQRSHRLIK
ncbi:NAD-glutamate dehydrogenase [Kangiella sediminilitoris]|uniref:NAD-glutamate dehydrogenase n=1 Tax=Kangiella sediminilitoris TaxID=1144748 RepID=A0A1B3B953_9GAMM|nr:NAD-glutamate dehydrogenase [Kangiella sediminilitoris]AOE49311.1 NAD-glutamate dehydrogenase [Kangiella sediminilitoris]